MKKLTFDQTVEFIKGRRSLYPRTFSPQKATRNEIAEMLELARWAPTHKLTQPWRFVVFMGDSLHRLMELQQEVYLKSTPSEKVLQSKLDKLAENAARSSAFIAVVMKRDAEERVPLTEEICSVACAVQNMYLAMGPLELAGYWSTGGATNQPEMRKILGLSKKDLHLGWLIIGKPAVDLPVPGNRMKMENYVEWR